MPAAPLRKLLPILVAICALAAIVFAATAGGATSGTLKYNELPDPLQRGSYPVKRVDPLKLGTLTYQEPNGKGTAATATNESLTTQIRGVMFQPEGKPGKSPLIFLVHGNHGSCDTGTGPKCTIFKRNDEGYAYLGENLASWGYTVFSLDQDELISRQDGSFGKGMHARRLLMMAALDKLKAASEAPVAEGENSNVGELLVGKLDMTRIGLMGHSRGGDAVSSFLDYDRSRPVGERYPIRAVISLAPVDYERHSPIDVPFMSIVGSCDGDVSNLQGARLYERSQYQDGDPYPRYQVVQVGGNHDAYNTVWQADGDDAGQADAACAPDVKEGALNLKEKSTEPVAPNSIRLSGEAGPHFEVLKSETKPYRIENNEKLNPAANTRISGNPALMGDQEKLGLATMAAFFRRYVGGEGAFEPYLTGELAAEGDPSVPQSACPTSEAGKRIPCIDRVADSYTAPPDERLDVLRPDTEHPTTLDALGTKIEASGFSNAYQAGSGVTPRPATTANGISWCDPDPKQTEPGLLKEGEYPVAAKSCPNPAPNALGGQGTNETPGAESTAAPREHAPVNGSYGRQLSLAWQGPATLTTKIPAADGNVSGYRALTMSAAVNFFDTRNPARGAEGLWNPETAPQNFTIAVTDAEGHEATVAADSPRYGTALQQTLGSTSDRVHVILRDLRVPLSDLAAQGIDLSKVRQLQLRFGGPGMPASGSIQLADVRFQESVGGNQVLLDSTAPNAGPAEGAPTSGPNPVAEINNYPRANGQFELPNVTTVPGANVWTVDDNGVQCPNAEFEHIQEAVEFANPYDTIVVCPGTYAESSTPVNSEANPVQAGATNGLTINKPLKIIGAGAGLVKIKPAASSPSSLGGTEPYLRDGGGNVVTVSRQSLGSTEYDEEYVDISGVTIESPNNYAEAGVAFFNSSGRISNSVIGPLKKITKESELATKPYGYGVIATNSLVGTKVGAPERQVTITNSKIYGYQAGGVRIDDARGTDASATANEASGMNEVGYITRSTIEGEKSALFPQVGVQFHAGATGKVIGSRIANNSYATTPTKSAGVLLTGAETLNEGVSITGSLFTGDAYGVYNANAANTEVRVGAPVSALEDFWGSGGNPREGATETGPPEVEGISPKDTGGNASVLFAPVATAAPEVPAVPSTLPDAAPVGAIVNPGGGEAVTAGTAIEPVVAAEDDYGVNSVSLTADGAPLGTVAESPYTFAWTPSAAEAGKTVTLTATIVDSAGHTTTSTIAVPVAAAATPPGPPAPSSGGSGSGGSGKVGLGKIDKNVKKGTALLAIKVPGPGKLSVYGAGVKPVKRTVKKAGVVTVPIRAIGRALKTLKETGKVKLVVKIAFTPTGGKKTIRTKTVVLIRK